MPTRTITRDTGAPVRSRCRYCEAVTDSDSESVTDSDNTSTVLGVPDPAMAAVCTSLCSYPVQDHTLAARATILACWHVRRVDGSFTHTARAGMAAQCLRRHRLDSQQQHGQLQRNARAHQRGQFACRTTDLTARSIDDRLRPVATPGKSARAWEQPAPMTRGREVHDPLPPIGCRASLGWRRTSALLTSHQVAGARHVCSAYACCAAKGNCLCVLSS